MGVTPSGLLSCPGLTMDDLMIDWLHTVDKGVAADVVGNVLKEVMEMLPGANETQRRQPLWLKHEILL